MSSSSVRDTTPSGHRNSLASVRPTMAKADLKKVEEEKGRRIFGQICARAVELAGLIDKEAAARLGVEPPQFSRWLAGTENPQCWRFHQDDLLGPALIAAQAEQTEGVTMRTVIELRRKVG